jgi:protein ImuA
MTNSHDRTELVIRLRDVIASGGRGATDLSPFSTGWPTLDRTLPSGVRRGSLVELVGAGPGSGTGTVAGTLTRAACRSPGVVVIVDPAGEFYPPALAASGVPLDRLIVVRPETDADALWAADQALRSRAAAAVWLWRDRLTPVDSRRLKLSAADGGALGLVLRSDDKRQSTAADVQLTVQPLPSRRGRRLRVAVTRCRGGVPGAVAEIELDDVTGGEREGGRREASAVPAAAALAGPAGVG